VAYDFILFFKKLHLKSEWIGGAAAKTAISLEFCVWILEPDHDKDGLMSKST